MENFIAAIHIVVALVLITLVLIQDSKGGGALGIGGGGSNTLLGATGAQTLAAKMTRIVAIIFAITCLTLTYFSGKSQRSVLDTGAPISTAPTQQQPVAPTAAPAETPATTPPVAPPAETK